MEMLDTFDREGNFLGVKTREFCHGDNPGVYHKPVWIWMKDTDGEILVQRRSFLKKKGPGLYDMPSAGHVDAGESCIDACVRETTEELGLDLPKSSFRFICEYYHPSGWELAQVYIVEGDLKKLKITIDPREVDSIRWLKYDEFVKLLYSDEFCPHPLDYKDMVAKLLR